MAYRHEDFVVERAALCYAYHNKEDNKFIWKFLASIFMGVKEKLQSIALIFIGS